MSSKSKRKAASKLEKEAVPFKTVKMNNNDILSSSNDLLKIIVEDRLKVSDSVMTFNFIKKRVKILSESHNVLELCNGVVYWMSRDARVQDNWAFLFAQKLALKNEVPLHVCFCLVSKFLNATMRQFKFMLQANDVLPDFVKRNKMGAVVCEFSPLRVPAKWTLGVKENLPNDVPLTMVDAHNIIPCWIVSEKCEYAAWTLRKKINSNLDEYLTLFPPVIKHSYKSKITVESIDWNNAIEQCEVDRTVDSVDWAKPGYEAGIAMLHSFISNRLKKFDKKRNDPLADAVSNLSPWFHFGQISIQRCILEVKKFGSLHPESVAAFCEEAIVRRELAENFCYYNKNYDNLKGACGWAQATLNEHRNDERSYIYSKEELDQYCTHDDLWNSAQIQLVTEGRKPQEGCS